MKDKIKVLWGKITTLYERAMTRYVLGIIDGVFLGLIYIDFMYKGVTFWTWVLVAVTLGSIGLEVWNDYCAYKGRKARENV